MGQTLPVEARLEQTDGTFSLESINGAVARIGQANGVSVPVNNTLWRLVRAAASGHPVPEGDHGPWCEAEREGRGKGEL